MVNVWIDELTHCLKDNDTGELIDTEVVRIKRKSFLSKYNKKNGWYVNWGNLLDSCEIYALVIKGTVDIQGLIAIAPNADYKAVYISWMCCNPLSNKELTEYPHYSGIGGHLFAIAAKRSFDYGFEGELTAFASDANLLKHYCDKLNAQYLGFLHSYQFVIDGKQSKKIMEEYNYEWTDEEL